jgi:hypothetical protein
MITSGQDRITAIRKWWRLENFPDDIPCEATEPEVSEALRNARVTYVNDHPLDRNPDFNRIKVIVRDGKIVISYEIEEK